MNLRRLKYALPLLAYFGAWRSFHYTGIVVWLTVIFAFFVIPVVELLVAANNKNLGAVEESMAVKNKAYDWFLYLIVPLQYAALFLFLASMQQELAAVDRIGRIVTMGLLCGIFGINVAHELGHRINKREQFLSKSLLLTSLYMHFFIEHNRGHHKHVGTPQDPSTAPLGQSLYGFWFRSITGVYKKAWQIATEEQKKKANQWWQNEMLQFQLVQIAFCITIGFVFGWAVLGYFLIAATIGILLLETVNYIEHYGLQRKPTGDGRYERTQPHHSWNSNHVIGRLMLFELSRHSDHHYLASRKYQVLKHHEDSPQLPTGYPGSMLLALVPPLWFGVMDKKVVAMS